MKRRDFMKAAPAAAVLPVVAHELADSAAAQETVANQGAGGAEKAKAFQVNDKTFKNAAVVRSLQSLLLAGRHPNAS